MSDPGNFSTTRRCFVVLPGHGFDEVYDQAIRPAVEESGFSCRRIAVSQPDPRRAGSPLIDVVARLGKRDALVLHLPPGDPAASFELGFTHVLARYFVMIAGSEQDIPADARDMRVLVHGSDSASLKRQLQRELSRRIPPRSFLVQTLPEFDPSPGTMLGKLKKSLGELEAELASERQARASKEEDVGKARAELERARQAHASALEEVTQVQAELDSARQGRASAEEEAAQARADLESERQGRVSAKEEAAQARADLESERQVRVSAEEGVAQVRAKLGRARRGRASAEERIEQLAAELEALRADVGSGTRGRCFLLMPYEETWSDDVRDLIEWTVGKCGYECQRADEMPGGKIPQNVRKGLREADVVIADFSANNANVLLEYGIATGLDKRVVALSQTSQTSQNLPWDVRLLHIVEYDVASIDGVLKLIRGLENNLL